MFYLNPVIKLSLRSALNINCIIYLLRRLNIHLLLYMRLCIYMYLLHLWLWIHLRCGLYIYRLCLIRLRLCINLWLWIHLRCGLRLRFLDCLESVFRHIYLNPVIKINRFCRIDVYPAVHIQFTHITAEIGHFNGSLIRCLWSGLFIYAGPSGHIALKVIHLVLLLRLGRILGLF